MSARPSIHEVPGVSEARLAQHAIGLANFVVVEPAIVEVPQVADIINRPDTAVVTAKLGIDEIGYGDFGGYKDYTIHLVRPGDHFEVDDIERTR